MRAPVVLLACIGLLANLTAFAQPAPGTWQQVMAIEGARGEINAAAITATGDIVVGGFAQRAGPSVQGSGADAFVARYGPDGQQLWFRQFGGDNRDEVLDLALDPDGSIVVTGWRDVIFTQKVQANSGFVSKYGPDGTLLWSTTLHDPSRKIAASSVLLLSDGAALLVGHDTPAGDGGGRVYFAKVSADGKLLWEFNPPAFVVGKTPHAKQAIVTRKPDGRVFAFEHGYVGRIDAEKTVEVRVRQGGWVDEFDARCYVITLDTGDLTDGQCVPAAPQNLYAARGPLPYSGGRQGPFDVGDPVFRKHDGSGAEVWARTLESEAGDGVHAVAATPDGGVVGVGFILDGPKVERHNWDGLLIKLDAQGNEVWRRRMGGSRRDEFTSVGVLPDGSIVAAGYTGSQGAEEWAPWLLRLSPSGELEGAAMRDLEQRQQ